MMDHKAIFNVFKKQQVDEYFSFDLFPILFLELLKYGADKTILTELFISDFLAMFLPKDSPAIHIKAIECMEYYTKEFLPTPLKKTEIVKKTIESAQKTEVLPVTIDQATLEIETKPKKIDPIEIPQISYNDTIPTDAEEGDGTYIPEDQRLYFKPEECASKQYDWDFINRIGAVIEDGE